MPVDKPRIERLDPVEKDEQFPERLFPFPRNIGAQQQPHCRPDNPVHIAVDRKIVVDAREPTFAPAERLNRLGKVDPAARTRERLRAFEILARQSAFNLRGDPFGQNGGAQIRHVPKLLRRDVAIALLAKRLKRVREHIINVPNRNHLIALLSFSAHAFAFFGSSNQYSFKRGASSYSTILERVCLLTSSSPQK